VSVPSSKAGSKLLAFEDGTDTWFRNVGILYIDAGEIPKRTYTIFKSRRKLEIYNTILAYQYHKNEAESHSTHN